MEYRTDEHKHTSPQKCRDYYIVVEAGLRLYNKIIRRGKCPEQVTTDLQVLPAYGVAVLVATTKIAARTITQRKTSKNTTAIGIRTTAVALPPLKRCTAIIE
jgi:hypothetical protein